MDVLTELLMHGSLTASQISLFTGKDESKVQKSILSLLKAGFLLENGNGDDAIWEAKTLSEIEQKDLLNPKQVRYLRSVVMLDEVENLRIMKYTGLKGIRKVYLEVLNEAITNGDTIYAFESNRKKSDLDATFLDKYAKKRIRNKVRASVIAPKNESDTQYKREYEGKYTEVKLVDDLSLDVNVNIVGDLVMTFSLNPPEGTLRRSKAEADTWRSIFMTIWKSE